MDATAVGAAESGANEDARRRNLSRLLKPKSIAVVGASSDLTKAGSRILKALAAFPGRVFAVHPSEKRVQGIDCFPSIAALPEVVDLAVMAIPARYSVAVAQEAAVLGVGGLLTISSGFAEASANGASMQGLLADICRRSSLRLLGPNTAGFLDPQGNCFPTFMRRAEQMRKGRIGIVSQSGGVNGSLCFMIDRMGEGISMAVGLGNALDVGSADVLPFLADDPNTAVIVVALEGVPQGRKLFDAMRAVTPRKPVIVLAAGRADVREFAMSHTGNLMGSHQRTVAALAQAGAVVVDSIESAAQAACILSCVRLGPRENPTVALVTGQAGPGMLIMSELKSAGIAMPVLEEDTIRRVRSLLPPLTFVNNPVDTGLPLPAFPEIVGTVCTDPKIDMVLAFSLAETVVIESASALVSVNRNSGKPLILGILGASDDICDMVGILHEGGVPLVPGPAALALAGVVLAADSKASWRVSQAKDPCPPRQQPRIVGDCDEYRAKSILEQYGIQSPRRVLCHSRIEALGAFGQMQKPVVVKIAAADIAHKTDVGGVHLNIRNEQELDAALDAIARIPSRSPGKVLVEEMAPAGVELIVGGMQDSSWGPVVMIGLGGVLAEALEDTAVRLAPLQKMDVEEMLNGLRGRKLLDGFRNLPACDRAAIASVAMSLGRLLMEHPEVLEVEINPLRVYATGAVALDAVLRLQAD